MKNGKLIEYKYIVITQRRRVKDLEEQVQLVLTGRLAQECVASSCYPLVKALGL